LILTFFGKSTRQEFFENSPLARYFNNSLAFSNVRRVLSQYKTWLSLLYLLYDIDLHQENKLKTTKHARTINMLFHPIRARVLKLTKGEVIFSNSLIIHEDKTKKITSVTEVWICGYN
jgi:hypothetical protein